MRDRREHFTSLTRLAMGLTEALSQGCTAIIRVPRGICSLAFEWNKVARPLPDSVGYVNVTDQACQETTVSRDMLLAFSVTFAQS
jgi:hypothetical protein